MNPRDALQRLDAAVRRQDTPNLRPRDAASLVVIDTTAATPKLLFGKRHPNQVFIPGKFVFPGGRVDPADSRLTAGDKLSGKQEKLLLAGMRGRPSPRRARALALAAVRELFEETGLLLGTPDATVPPTRAAGWREFLATGHVPRIGSLRFFARAITPPRRPRRYDTRFFVVNKRDIAGRPAGGDGELTELRWLSLDEARGFDLHVMTRTILEELAALIDTKGSIRSPSKIPLYAQHRGRFHRELLSP